MSAKGPNSHDRYQAKRPQIEPINRAKRADRHKLRMSKQFVCTKRGTARRLARTNIVAWKERRDAKNKNTGNVFVKYLTNRDTGG